MTFLSRDRFFIKAIWWSLNNRVKKNIRHVCDLDPPNDLWLRDYSRLFISWLSIPNCNHKVFHVFFSVIDSVPASKVSYLKKKTTRQTFVTFIKHCRLHIFSQSVFHAIYSQAFSLFLGLYRESSPALIVMRYDWIIPNAKH